MSFIEFLKFFICPFFVCIIVIAYVPKNQVGKFNDTQKVRDKLKIVGGKKACLT